MFSTLKSCLLLSAASVMLMALSTPAPARVFMLTQIEVGIFNQSGTNSVMLSLDNSSGGLPGATIESWTLTGLPASPFPNNGDIVQTVKPVSPVSLVSGAEYWIVASPIAGDTTNIWALGLAGEIAPLARNTGTGWAIVNPDFFARALAVQTSAGVVYDSFGSGNTYSFSGALVTGAATPDGFAEIGESFTIPIPEPSTWAMMALGFAGLGLVGYRSNARGAKVQGA